MISVTSAPCRSRTRSVRISSTRPSPTWSPTPYPYTRRVRGSWMNARGPSLPPSTMPCSNGFGALARGAFRAAAALGPGGTEEIALGHHRELSRGGRRGLGLGRECPVSLAARPGDLPGRRPDRRGRRPGALEAQAQRDDHRDQDRVHQQQDSLHEASTPRPAGARTGSHAGVNAISALPYRARFVTTSEFPGAPDRTRPLAAGCFARVQDPPRAPTPGRPGGRGLAAPPPRARGTGCFDGPTSRPAAAAGDFRVSHRSPVRPKWPPLEASHLRGRTARKCERSRAKTTWCN
jgi:hypothetical protein